MDDAVDRKLAGRTVLMIDDNQDTRSFCRAILVQTGASVLEAPSGKRGVEVAKTGHPDVVLCDLRMPGMDGYHVLEAIRALGPDQGGSVPVIAIAAFQRLEDYAKVRNPGFDFFLAKPINPDELVRAVGEVLGQAWE